MFGGIGSGGHSLIIFLALASGWRMMSHRRFFSFFFSTRLEFCGSRPRKQEGGEMEKEEKRDSRRRPQISYDAFFFPRLFV